MVEERLFIVNWQEQQVLITGGTGSLGNALTAKLLRWGVPRIVIFSRDELKQSEMFDRFSDSRLRFFLGDVRDRVRLMRAFYGITTVIHAAALKRVEAAEYNPSEAVCTNVIGALNVADAAIDAGIERVMGVSTDKAVNPINLYGCTKALMERIFVHANSYAGKAVIRFACVRYGNVLGSRGSVVKAFLSQRHTGKIRVTDPSATRFFITIWQAVNFVLSSIEQMKGGEVFVPKPPSADVRTVAEVLASGCVWDLSGLGRGEKLDEVLISKDERYDDVGDRYIVCDSGKIRNIEFSSARARRLSAEDVLSMINEK